MTLPNFGQPVDRGGGGGASIAEVRADLEANPIDLAPGSTIGGSGLGWELIQDITVPSSTSQVSITGLDGNLDGAYRLVMALHGPAGGTSSINLRFNGDTGFSYNVQELLVDGATVTGARSTSQSSIPLTHVLDLGDVRLIQAVISTMPFSVRKVIASSFDNIIAGIALSQQAGEWTNTSANLTSIQILTSGGDNFDFDSRIWLFKPTKL